MKKNRTTFLLAAAALISCFSDASLYAAAATQAISVPEKTSEYKSLPVLPNTTIYQGTLVAEDSNGDARPAADTAGLRVVGRAEQTVTNTTATATLSITGVASTDVFTSTTTHHFSVGDRVTLPTLTGGTNLTASDSTTYYVISVPSATTFTLSTTLGGSSVDFATDISAGTLKRWPAALVRVKRGVFLYHNAASNTVTDTSRGKACFVTDDNTVATTSTYLVKAGLVEDVTTDGVWVNTTLNSLVVPTAVSLTGAATATTSATNSSPYGYSQAQANAIVTNLNATVVDVAAIKAALVTAGILR